MLKAMVERSKDYVLKAIVQRPQVYGDHSRRIWGRGAFVDDLFLLEACQHVSANVVPVEVKYCPSYLQGFNRHFIRQEAVSIYKLDSMPLQYGNCLLNFIAFIDSACDLTPLHGQVQARPGQGLIADDFNRMSISACQQQTPPICLQVVDLERVLPNLQCPLVGLCTCR